MKTWILIATGILLSAFQASAADYTLTHGKVLREAEVLSVTNNLIRILHSGGDNIYQIEYFTRSSRKALKAAEINHALREKIDAEKEAEKARKKARLQLKADIAPPFPVSLSDVKYLGGDVVSMTVSNALDTNVVVQVVSSRIVQQTLVLKPRKVKQRVMFRHERGRKFLVKANKEQKEFEVKR